MKKPEENQLLRAGELYRELGYHLIYKNRYVQAIASLNESLKTNTDDIRTLMGRSIANGRMMNMDKALEDIEKVLEIDGENMGVLQQQAFAEYLCTNFEKAMLLNEKGAPLKSQPPIFQMGIMQCQEALECCVAEKAGHCLRDFYGVIKKLEAKKRFNAEIAFKNRYKKKEDPKKLKAKEKAQQKNLKKILQTMEPTKSIKSLKSNERPEHEEDKEKKHLEISEEYQNDEMHTKGQMVTELVPEIDSTVYRPIQLRTVNIRRLVAEKYLERMCRDKLTLENLVKTPSVSPNIKGCQVLNKLVRSGYNQTIKLQETLRTRQPFYAIRFRETEATKSIAEKQKEELRILQTIAKNEADGLLNILRKAREEKNLRQVTDIADRAKAFFDSKSRKVLVRKPEYLELLYNIVGLAYLDTKRVNIDALSYEKEKRCLFMLGLPISREPSTDSLIKSMKPVFTDLTKVIQVFENRIKLAKTSLELAWLYHELSVLYIEKKKLELGRHYAYRCIEQANFIHNEVWAINGSFLVVKVFMLQRNRNEAKLEIYETLEKARRIDYPKSENLIGFIKGCLQVIEDADFDELVGKNVIQEREEAIIKLLETPNMKDDVGFLFKKMSTLPAARRMSIMPGVAIKDEEELSPASAAAKRKSSIAASKTMESFKGGRGGTTFLEMIEHDQ